MNPARIYSIRAPRPAATRLTKPLARLAALLLAVAGAGASDMFVGRSRLVLLAAVVFVELAAGTSLGRAPGRAPVAFLPSGNSKEQRQDGQNYEKSAGICNIQT